MGKVYSRNLAQRRIFVSKFAHGISDENENAYPSQSTYRNFRKQVRGGASLGKEVQGKQPSDWALSFLEEREQLDVPKKGRSISRGSFLGKTVPVGQSESGPLVSQESRMIPGKPRKTRSLYLGLGILSV